MSSTDGQQVSRPLQIILGVVVALAALYALWSFVLSPLLSGDDGDDVAGGPTTPPAAATEPDGESATSGAADGAATGADESEAVGGITGQPVPETFEIFTARDPFQQLVIEATVGDETTGQVVEPEEGATPEPTESAEPGDDADDASAQAPDSGSSTTDSGAGSAATAGDDASGGDDGTDEAEGGDSGGSVDNQARPAGGEFFEPGSGTGTEVTLVSTEPAASGEVLVVDVDGGRHTVGEGEVFADRFQLLDIDGRCATMLFGDSRFTICEGETISK